MKKLVIATLMLTSTFTFASSYEGSEEEKMTFFEKVKSLVLVERVVDALQLKGEANVWVTVDADGILHVEDVDTDNFIKEFHIRQSLEGIQMPVSDAFAGKTFSLVFDFGTSKNAEQSE